MAHNAEIISKIKLPNGTTYELHDAEAIHSIADLENLGLNGVFQYKGTVAAVGSLPTTAESGWVYHVTETDSEFVWVDAVPDGEDAHWEEFGTHFLVDHTHTISPTQVTVEVNGTNSSSAVTGTAAVEGSNAASAVTGTAVVNVPSVSKVAQYAKFSGSVSDVGLSDSKADAITGFGAHTTAKAITELNTTTIKNPSVTSVSIPNVTKNDAVTASKITSNENVPVSKITSNTDVTASKVTTSAGSAASWTASVDNNGVLSFAWTANVPTAVTANDVVASKVAAQDVIASKVVANDVDATKVTLGTSLSASSVTLSDVTVATGSKSTADAITGLGTATTTKFLTEVEVATQPVLSGEIVTGGASDFYTGDLVSISSTSTVGSIDGIAAPQVWEQTKGDVTGTAAAQAWNGNANVTGTTDPATEIKG